MIREFTDRHPGASAALIAAGLYLVPGVLMFLDDMLLRGRLHAASLFFFFSLAVQTAMFLTVGRPILAVEPFILGLVGLCAGEILYALSESVAAPGMGPSPGAYLISSYLIAVSGGNAAAAVGALVLFLILLLGRKVYERIKYGS